MNLLQPTAYGQSNIGYWFQPQNFQACTPLKLLGLIKYF
uniref:Uncharacterized protein n=1 Tax=Anguilla anguilla TaxID=7936 RepID=A0A0E9PK81_ANGAN